MKFFCILLLTMIFPSLLLPSPSIPIQTDYVIFLFDNGDKNMIASMLKYAEEHDRSRLDHLDFRIVFMGASVDAIAKEPFSHYPDKLVHYKQLNIEEMIDHHWKRDKKLEITSLNKLSENIRAQKKVWLGVSCSIFEQILQQYQNDPNIEVVAIRDNPSPDGDTDYFKVAKEVQSVANKIAVPSKAVFAELDSINKEIVIIGHAPIEEWLDEACHLNKAAIINRLGLNPQLPIIVYAGVYGDYYEDCFSMFLKIFPDENLQLLIVPHPRYKGVVETKLCENLKYEFTKLNIVGEFEEDALKRIRTIEALAIADIVVTADATSTIVFQANALKKKVIYVNPISSKVSNTFCDKKLLYKISDHKEFLKIVKGIQLEKKNNISSSVGEDVFELLGIPRHGAKLLWDELAK